MRGAVSLDGVQKQYGGQAALRDLTLSVQPGEFLTLLGPSGCGKTTLLRLLAGFETQDAGSIHISGRDMAGLPPHRRPVNTVFQHYALFPHRTVAGNVAFGLEMQRVAPGLARERVARALSLVRLSGFEQRRIDQLSGGERQRVALARAVVLEPEVLLLDEPMSALDRKLRQEMQVEVKNLQERLGTTFVFVTHDHDEALTMSDRIAVMSHGRIEQVGTPEALYERPRTRFVAEFLAVRNILEATVVAVGKSRAQLRVASGLEITAFDDGGFQPGTRVAIGVRPERIAFGGQGENRLPGRLDDEIYLGDRTDWRVRLEGADDFLFTVAESAALARARKRGDDVLVTFEAEAVLRLDAALDGR